MADEFIKGLGIFTGAGLAWLTLASWYRTEEFGSTDQLVAPVTVEQGANLFNTLGVVLMDILFWFALFGPLMFWILIPAWRETKDAIERRQNA